MMKQACDNLKVRHTSFKKNLDMKNFYGHISFIAVLEKKMSVSGEKMCTKN